MVLLHKGAKKSTFAEILDWAVLNFLFCILLNLLHVMISSHIIRNLCARNEFDES